MINTNVFFDLIDFQVGVCRVGPTGLESGARVSELWHMLVLLVMSFPVRITVGVVYYTSNFLSSLCRMFDYNHEYDPYSRFFRFD